MNYAYMHMNFKSMCLFQIALLTFFVKKKWKRWLFHGQNVNLYRKSNDIKSYKYKTKHLYFQAFSVITTTFLLTTRESPICMSPNTIVLLFPVKTKSTEFIYYMKLPNPFLDVPMSHTPTCKSRCVESVCETETDWLKSKIGWCFKKGNNNSNE